MRIVIDARMYDQSGIGRYIRNLLAHLQIIDGENEYFIFLLKKRFTDLEFGNKKFKKILADIGWYGIAEQIKIPKLLYEINADLAHFPHFNVPLSYKKKFVVTIHDLIHQHFQMRRATLHDPITYRIKHLGYKTVFKNAISKSEKIIVPSNYVKKILNEEWQVKDEHVLVAYEGIDKKISEIAREISEGEINNVRKKFNITSPYLFYVGNAHPHKNVESLISAFRQIKKENPNWSLVLSGDEHYFWQRIKNENQNAGIIYTGYVSDEELVALYKEAVCFVLPSFEEGFGIPILEAQVCGCPVVASNVASIPEIAGKGVILVNPHRVDDIVKGIRKVRSGRNDLMRYGLENIKRFSWRKMAEQTLAEYLKCESQ